MRSRYITATLFAIIAAVGGLRAQPRIALVGGESIDLGYVTPGRIAFEIRITNTGTGQLLIADVDSEIATIEGIDTTVLAPGDTATARATMNTTNTVGRKSAWVRIESSDPARRYVNVQLLATAMRHLYSGGTAVSGTVGEVLRSEITIVNMSPIEVTVAPVTEQVGCCDCHADVWADFSGSRRIAAGDSIEVSIGMVARRPGGSRCELELKAEDPSIPPSRVPLSLYATEPEGM